MYPRFDRNRAENNGRKIILSGFVGPGGHFAPSIVSITHFATILKFCKYLEIFVNFVGGQNGRNFHPADCGQNQRILLWLAKYVLWQLLWTMHYLWQVFGTSRVTLDPFLNPRGKNRGIRCFLVKISNFSSLDHFFGRFDSLFLVKC